MKKKTIALLLTAVVSVSLVLSACGEKKPESSAASSKTETSAVSEESKASSASSIVSEITSAETSATGNSIVVGTITDTTGDPSSWWEIGAADMTVRDLVYGYSTVEMTKDKKFEFNMTVLKDVQETTNEDGSKTVKYTLQDDLVWSNGEKITAKDYVFGPLFLAHKETVSALGMNHAPESTLGIDGQEAYTNGEANTLKGVRLLGEYEFSITLSKDFMPNYFEKNYFAVKPTYMKGWVSADIDVVDTEEGAKLSDNYSAAAVGEQVNAYRYKPTAFSGPYTVEKYDNAALIYTLKKNPNFKGNYEGQKPNIETIMLKKVTQETMMDELSTGSVDMLLEVTDGNLIQEGLDKVDEGAYQGIQFDRAGYGYLTFKCNFGPTQFVEVRKAVAHLLDRNEFAKQFTQGFGMVVHGPYGTAMWEYQNAKDKIASLNSYPYDFATAEKFLVDGGWTKDANGGEWKGEGLRHKEVDGKLMPLQINWVATEKNAVADLITSMLVNSPDVKKIGLEILPTTMTFSEMQTKLNDPNQTEFHMFNLATGWITPVYDVSQMYAIGASPNVNQIADEQLAKLAKGILVSDPKDPQAYLNTWVEFIQRWNELVPALPLYSNRYYDFYSNRIQDYKDRDAYWSFRYAILYAKVA